MRYQCHSSRGRHLAACPRDGAVGVRCARRSRFSMTRRRSAQSSASRTPTSESHSAILRLLGTINGCMANCGARPSLRYEWEIFQFAPGLWTPIDCPPTRPRYRSRQRIWCRTFDRTDSNVPANGSCPQGLLLVSTWPGLQAAANESLDSGANVLRSIVQGNLDAKFQLIAGARFH